MSNKRRVRLTEDGQAAALAKADQDWAKVQETGIGYFRDSPHPIDGTHIWQLDRTAEHPVSFPMSALRAVGHTIQESITIVSAAWPTQADMDKRTGSLVIPDYLTPYLVTVAGKGEDDPFEYEDLGWIKGSDVRSYPVVVTGGERGYRVPFGVLNVSPIPGMRRKR